MHPTSGALGSAILATDAATPQMRWAPRGTPYPLSRSRGSSTRVHLIGDPRHRGQEVRRTLSYIKQPS